MKAEAFSLLGLAAILAVLAVSSDAEATAQCQPDSPTANTCMGISMVGTTTGGTSSGRCFFLTTASAAPACTTGGVGTTGNQASWEMVAGACITVRYYDVANGALPPLAPNKVTIQSFFDTAGTNLRTYLNAGAEPANGQTYSFCATSDGTPTGDPRAGSYYMHARLVKDNAVPSSFNYNIATTGVATVGAVSSFDSGMVRGQMLVSDVSRNAYPAGSTFAYGASADESITVTSTFTPPGGEASAETMANTIVDSSTLAIGQVGASTEVDAGSLAQDFVADNTFPNANGPYVPGLTIVGNAFNGLKWTVFASTGHGAGITRVSDTFVYAASFNIDPRIKMDSDGAGGFASADETDRSYAGGSCSGSLVEVFNRGETACTAWSLVNSRGEYLTRTMTHARYDAVPTLCASNGALTPTGTTYSVSGAFSTSATCLAAADTTGSARHLVITNTDQSYTSGTIYYLSSLLFVDSHIQVASTLVPDDHPTDDAGEDLEYFIRDNGAGGDDSDTIRQWCFVDGVRHDLPIDTTGSAITRTIKDPTATTRATGTTDTGSDGWTPSSANLLASTPLGDDWTAQCTVTFAGNTGTDTETFEVGVEGGGGGETVYTGADPLTIFGGNVANGSVPITVHSRLLDGEARVGVADQIFVSVYEWPAMTPVVTGGSVVEVDATNAPGAYVYNLTSPGPGAYLIAANTTDGATPIGAHNVIVLANSTVADILASINGHRDTSLEVLMTSDFAGIGFDGFLFLMFWIAAILFFVYKDWAFSLAFTIPGILDTLFPADIPGEFAQYLLFCLLGVVMQYFVGDRQKFSLHGKKKPTGA